jgi:hypothetical protein
MVTEQDIDNMLGEDEAEGQEVEVKEVKDQEEGEVQEQEVKNDEQEETETGDAKATPAPELTPEQIIEQQNERLKELEKVNNGILQAKTSAAARARQAQEESQALKEKLAALEKQIELTKAAKADTEKVDGEQKIDRIQVDFDDDGNAFVPIDRIPANNDLVKKLQTLESELNQTKHTLTETQRQRELQESMNDFLSQKDGWKEAFPVLQEQSQYLSAMFDQFVNQNQIDMPSDRQAAKDIAYEIASHPSFQSQFRAKYPDGDPERVMQAYLNGGKYYTAKALDAIAAAKKPVSAHKPLPKSKPAALGTVIGSGTGKETESLEKYADMDLDDFLRLSPEEERRMERLLKEKGR